MSQPKSETINSPAPAPGRAPEHKRALELLRAGMTPMDVGIAVGQSSWTIKRWAKAAGIPIRIATLEERERRQAKSDRNRAARRAHDMGVTAPGGRGRW
jgi:hypothetical protein